jgi:hypothetical protein
VEDDDEYQSASSEIEEVSELPGNIQEEGHARLVIDTSRDTEDSTCKDDIELVEADFREEKTVTEGEQVTVKASDEEDLGYTDMDSVD